LAFVANHPEAATSFQTAEAFENCAGTSPAGGRRGGARVTYYYHSQSVPLLIHDMYPKNAKINLTNAERNAMKKLIPKLIRALQQKEA
jgi:hypothetical protein